MDIFDSCSDSDSGRVCVYSGSAFDDSGFDFCHLAWIFVNLDVICVLRVGIVIILVWILMILVLMLILVWILVVWRGFL